MKRPLSMSAMRLLHAVVRESATRNDALTIEAGSSMFLHGPSGCGKSTLLGVVLGGVLAVVLFAAAGAWVQSRFGIGLKRSVPTVSQWSLLVAMLFVGSMASLVPGLRVYRMSLADGPSPRT